MKHIFLMSLFFSVSAMAVETKNCPETLLISYDEISIVSDQQLRINMNDELNWYDTDKVFETRDELHDLAYQNLELKLFSKKNSECRYIRYGEKPNGDNETRIITRDGQNVIRVSLKANEEDFWIYHTVKAFSPADLSVISENSSIRGYFDHGAPRIKMGRASGFSVIVK